MKRSGTNATVIPRRKRGCSDRKNPATLQPRVPLHQFLFTTLSKHSPTTPRGLQAAHGSGIGMIISRLSSAVQADPPVEIEW